MLRSATFAIALTGALVVAAAGRAEAKMMEHLDLAGLVLSSDAVVIAKRTAAAKTADGSVHYTVVRSLRGKLAPGADVLAWDELYGLGDMHAIDAEVLLFVQGDRLVSSGVRVFEHNQAFRFEQWNNPGGWQRVPQGKDPDDNWNGTETPISRSEFDRELALAFTRVDALAVARTIPDPAKRRAALLALLPPIGSTKASSPGFYVDVMTQAIEDALVAGGDLEAALEASRHDHSFANVGHSFGDLGAIMAIASDSSRPLELRTTALTVAVERNDFVSSEAAGRTAIALLADPAPEIRSVAAVAVERPSQVMTSDAKDQARLDKLARDGRTAATALLRRETDPRVLYAIGSAFRQRPLGGSPRQRVAAQPQLRRGRLSIDVVCLASGAKFSMRGATVSAAGSLTPVSLQTSISYGCGNDGEGSGSTGTTTLPPGRYRLTMDATVDGKKQVFPLGGISSDGKTLALDP